MALSELERRVVAVIEESWMSNASLKTPAQISELFGITEKAASELLVSENIRNALSSRGVPTSDAIGLSPEQVTAINTIVNPMDTRSRRKKLQDMDVSAAKWAGWLKQPQFYQYFANQSRVLLKEAIPEAQMALVDNVLRGDLGSIKYLNEMTGEYRGDDQQINPAELVQKIIEVLQVHIQDPVLLLTISQDLLGLAGGDRIKSPSQIVSGEVIPTPVAPFSSILEM